jgi:hypothetical protein
MKCEHKTLIGSQFCGKHIRLKNPRIWMDNTKRHNSVVKIQKVWRGFMVRNMFRLLRKDVKKHEYANTEDLFTFDDSHILDKFEISENGKNWWFDIRTIYDWSYRSAAPTNPYTKNPLEIQDLSRIREVISIRRIRAKETLHDGKILGINENFMIISQILNENYLEIHPNRFLSLNIFQITAFLTLLEADLRVWTNQHPSDLRKGYHYLINRFLTQQFSLPLEIHLRILCNSILYMLRNIKNNYDICFMVASAMYRV